MENLRRIALLAVLFQIGFCLEVQNPDEPNQQFYTRVAEKGSSITLKCKELLDASLGDSLLVNVLKWNKVQPSQDVSGDIMDNDPLSGLEVSSHASPNPPFSVNGRVTLNSEYDTTSVTVDLIIASVTEEDSGWYTCFSRNTNGEVKYIAYDVQVYVPPTSLILTGKPNQDYNGSLVSGALLFYSTSSDGVLECTAVQGNPAPTLSMHIEGESNSLTGFGTPVVTRSLEGDIEGLQRIVYNTTVTLTNVQMKADQNGRRVFCVASDSRSTATSQPPVSASRELNILYKPEFIDCDQDWKANVGDANVKFSCTFVANPAPKVLWKSRPRTEIYPDGKIVDSSGSSYSASVMALSRTKNNNSIFQTDLNMVRITEDSYHGYEVELSNILGTVTMEFVLDVGETVVVERPVSAAPSYFATSSLLLCVLAAFTTYLLRQ